MLGLAVQPVAQCDEGDEFLVDQAFRRGRLDSLRGSRRAGYVSELPVSPLSAEMTLSFSPSCKNIFEPERSPLTLHIFHGSNFSQRKALLQGGSELGRSRHRIVTTAEAEFTHLPVEGRSADAEPAGDFGDVSPIMAEGETN